MHVEWSVLKKFITPPTQTDRINHGLYKLTESITDFLGGLSLHLNHLIGSCMAISYWQFGTLPIGIFLSNLDSTQLMTSPRTLFGQFWHMLIFGDLQGCLSTFAKIGCLQKINFFSMKEWQGFKVFWGFRWAGPWAIWWYHFLAEVWHTWGVWRGFESKGSIVPHICNSLEGTQHSLISSRNSP